MNKTENKGIFKTQKELTDTINKYFDRLKGEIMLDENNLPVSGKNGFIYEIEPKPPTISGLAFALGLKDKKEILNFDEKNKFYPIIKRALLKIEEYLETELMDKSNSAGAKYILENNFNWCDEVLPQENNEFSLEIKVVN